ncbi:MAG: polyphosphate polymerase domain-containing protein [Balneolaceae bacterium]|nr:polyphosphate polymerase domain-containing protein [Balneolaceae bacterium]
MDDKLQNKRFEYKYRLKEPKAREVSHFVGQYLECDPYGAEQPDHSYTVQSLYLDSPSLKTYHDTINGTRNRFKLRIRYYTGNPEQPVYLEIKRRYDTVIRKKRAIVHRNRLTDLLGGQLPTSRCLVKKTPEQRHTLDQFCMLMNQLNAEPKVHVKYRREAYELPDSNSVRVTFDREVQTERISGGKLVENLQNPTSIFGSTVVLEIKFTNRYPHWLQEITERYHLWRESAAKYVDGILRLNGFPVEKIKSLDYELV